MSNKMNLDANIRQAELGDLDQLIWIEEQNFSPEEAASPAALKERIQQISDTFLVLVLEGQVAGYVVGPALPSRYLTDEVFDKVVPNLAQGGFIAIQSLSVHPDYQGQGLGTLLLAALKEVAVQQNRAGISLTCHDYLVSYYEMNGFTDEGISNSTHGGAAWFNLVWDNPYHKEEA